MKKILILNDGSNYENWGIKACIDGLLKILNSGDENFIIEGLPHSYMHRKSHNQDLKIHKNYLQHLQMS